VAKAPIDIKSLARVHTEAAIKTLVGIMNQKKAPPSARAFASTSLLDRGWGKPAQIIAGDADLPPVRLEQVQRTIVRPPDPDS
jgi:hypothetical protein